MGEFADYFIGEVMDFEDSKSDYRRGDMTIEEAYEKGIINEMGGEIGTERHLIVRTCRNCGKTGLRWVKINDKWRLFEGNNQHDCNQTKG